MQTVVLSGTFSIVPTAVFIDFPLLSTVSYRVKSQVYNGIVI